MTRVPDAIANSPAIRSEVKRLRHRLLAEPKGGNAVLHRRSERKLAKIRRVPSMPCLFKKDLEPNLIIDVGCV